MEMRRNLDQHSRFLEAVEITDETTPRHPYADSFFGQDIFYKTNAFSNTFDLFL